jgi:serpin B
MVCNAPNANANTLSAVESGDAGFATDLLTRLAEQAQGKNFFYSPHSVSMALAMTYGGAATQTASQMAQVLHLPESAASAQDLPRAYSELNCAIQADGQAGGNQLDIANSLFGQQGVPFKTSFLNVLQNDYGAPLQQVDFMGNAQGATDTINQWVANQTQGLIPQLFAPGNLNGSTRLVLVNAIYFKGAWASAFDPSSTMPGTFLVSSTQQIQAPLMNQTAQFGYTRGDAFSLLELPYTGAKIAMDILLPDTVDGLAALLGEFTAAKLSAWTAQLQPTLMAVTLPKFTLSSNFILNQTLSAMGMPLAFQPGAADFSGMDGQRDLFIATVAHQAKLQVDESGTVAAAATGTGVHAQVAHVPVAFNANHPFLLVLRDLGTGALLFVGQVTNPTQN